MVSAPFRVVLDANVLFPLTVRDTLLRAAAVIPAMPNNEMDRHVTAVAVKADAHVIVTSNLKDFHPMPDGIEARSPDDFLLDLFDLGPADMVELLRRQAAALTRPPVTLEQVLTGLGKTVPRFVEAVRELLDSEGKHE
jgi:hypothetical protein